MGVVIRQIWDDVFFFFAYGWWWWRWQMFSQYNSVPVATQQPRCTIEHWAVNWIGLLTRWFRKLLHLDRFEKRHSYMANHFSDWIGQNWDTPVVRECQPQEIHHSPFPFSAARLARKIPSMADSTLQKRTCWSIICPTPYVLLSIIVQGILSSN